MKFLTILLYVISLIIFFAIVTSIIWYFLTTKFPTHSDVFWLGVQAGALGVLAIIFLILGLLFLHRFVITARK